MNELTTTQQLIEMSKMQTVTLEKVDNLEKGLLQAQNDIQEIMDTSYLHPGIINMITKKRRKRVIDCMGGKSAKAYKTFKVDEEGRKHRFSSEVFREMELDFKAEFDLNSYAELSKSKKEEVLEYIAMWEPCTNTKRKINLLNKQTELELIG
ncbi:TPA: ORF6C domain-containing protein [Streptococcus agalactiae]